MALAGLTTKNPLLNYNISSIATQNTIYHALPCSCVQKYSTRGMSQDKYCAWLCLVLYLSKYPQMLYLSKYPQMLYLSK